MCGHNLWCYTRYLRILHHLYQAALPLAYTLYIAVNMNLYNLLWGWENIFDALLE